MARPEVTDHLTMDRSDAFEEALELFADNEAMLAVLQENPDLLPASIRLRTESKPTQRLSLSSPPASPMYI